MHLARKRCKIKDLGHTQPAKALALRFPSAAVVGYYLTWYRDVHVLWWRTFVAPLYLNNTHQGEKKISRSPLAECFCCYGGITVPTRGVQQEMWAMTNLSASRRHGSSRKASVQLLRAHPSCVFRIKPHLQSKRNIFNLHKLGSLCVFPLSWEPGQLPQRSAEKAHERC